MQMMTWANWFLLFITNMPYPATCRLGTLALFMIYHWVFHSVAKPKILFLVVIQEGIDVGTLLRSTCNTFLKTLEECMQIANAAFTSELLYHTPPGSPQLAVLKSSKVKAQLPFSPVVQWQSLRIHAVMPTTYCLRVVCFLSILYLPLILCVQLDIFSSLTPHSFLL